MHFWARGSWRTHLPGYTLHASGLLLCYRNFFVRSCRLFIMPQLGLTFAIDGDNHESRSVRRPPTSNEDRSVESQRRRRTPACMYTTHRVHKKLAKMAPFQSCTCRFAAGPKRGCFGAPGGGGLGAVRIHRDRGGVGAWCARTKSCAAEAPRVLPSLFFTNLVRAPGHCESDPDSGEIIVVRPPDGNLWNEVLAGHHVDDR
jgi:hypothetical protein